MRTDLQVEGKGKVGSERVKEGSKGEVEADEAHFEDLLVGAAGILCATYPNF